MWYKNAHGEARRRRSGQADPRVDAYIKKAQPFAQPILAHLRKVVHRTVPEVEETMKWSTPHFDYKGMFCGIAAFKEHVAFGFWKAGLMKEHLPGAGLVGRGSVRQDRDDRRTCRATGSWRGS